MRLSLGLKVVDEYSQTETWATEHSYKTWQSFKQTQKLIFRF